VPTEPKDCRQASTVHEVHDLQLQLLATAIARMESKLDQINERLARGDTSLALLDSRLTNHEARITSLEKNDEEEQRSPGFFKEFILPHLVPVVLQLLVTAATVLIVLAASHGMLKP
jgi:hypothetical protein